MGRCSGRALRGEGARGFTLIELVMTIVIIGALAAIALPRFLDQSSTSEKAAIDGWVGALRSAQHIAFSGAITQGASGYTSPDQLSLFNLVRCDSDPQLGTGSGAGTWQGHHLALASLRGAVFQNPGAMACNGNDISFTTKSGRAVVITNSSAGVAWTASPAY